MDHRACALCSAGAHSTLLRYVPQVQNEPFPLAGHAARARKSSGAAYSRLPAAAAAATATYDTYSCSVSTPEAEASEPDSTHAQAKHELCTEAVRRPARR